MHSLSMTNAERAAALETALRAAGCLRYRGNRSHTAFFNNPKAADEGIAKFGPLATKSERGLWRVGGIEVEFFHV